MKKSTFKYALLSSLLFGSSMAIASDMADVIYKNGKIYTVDNQRSWAQAVAIDDGKFIAVGSDKQISKFQGKDTKVIDLQGGFAMPGLIDVHIHPSLLMDKRAFCALPGTFYEPTEQTILDELKKCIESYPKDRKWFIAQGYSTAAMSETTLTREVLDKLIPDRPAWIEDETGHNAWFNTKAMQLAGVNKEIEDTAEVFFSRTKEGDLAGVAFEGAMNPFVDALPPFDKELLMTAYSKLISEANEKGITAIGDAYVFERSLPAWEGLHKADKITSHIVLYLRGNLGTAELTPIETLDSWHEKYDLPGPKAVKLGMGGALESLSEPLVDGYLDPKANPSTIIPVDAFGDYVAQLDKAGYQVITHAIGDGTVRATIDGYEKVIKAKGKNTLRHRIDHCSLVHSDDFKRLADLDIACTIWPPLNAPVAYNVDGIKPVLKDATWKRMYPNRDMWDAGVTLANHTDAPAATLWPWWGMEASLTRMFPGKPENGSLNKNQALTLEEVITAYTINGAWSLNMDKMTGSIEVGKSADMIILNHNLFAIPITKVHKTKVKQTVFKGKVIYQQ